MRGLWYHLTQSLTFANNSNYHWLNQKRNCFQRIWDNWYILQETALRTSRSIDLVQQGPPATPMEPGGWMLTLWLPSSPNGVSDASASWCLWFTVQRFGWCIWWTHPKSRVWTLAIGRASQGDFPIFRKGISQTQKGSSCPRRQKNDKHQSHASHHSLFCSSFLPSANKHYQNTLSAHPHLQNVLRLQAPSSYFSYYIASPAQNLQCRFQFSLQNFPCPSFLKKGMSLVSVHLTDRLGRLKLSLSLLSTFLMMNRCLKLSALSISASLLTQFYNHCFWNI